MTASRNHLAASIAAGALVFVAEVLPAAVMWWAGSSGSIGDLLPALGRETALARNASKVLLAMNEGISRAALAASAEHSREEPSRCQRIAHSLLVINQAEPSLEESRGPCGGRGGSGERGGSGAGKSSGPGRRKERV